jgi:hypothetical protein
VKLLMDERSGQPAAARVLGHGDAEVDAALPEWIVIQWAVEGDGVDIPRGFLHIDAFRRARDGPLLVSLQHDRPVAQFADGVFEFSNGFLRRMRGNDRHRGKSCGIGREHVDRHFVVGTDRGPTQVILSNAVEREPEARIDQREVYAQLRQPFVHQGREQRRCFVEGLAGDAPPVAAAGAIVLALRPGGTVPRVIALPERSHEVDRLSAAHFAQVL